MREVLLADGQDRRYARLAHQEGAAPAGAVRMVQAHLLEHVDLLQLDELRLVHAHGLPVGVVRRGTGRLGRLAVDLGLLALLLGQRALLLGGSLDALVLDRVGRVGLADRELDHLRRQACLFDVRQDPLTDLLIDGVEGRRLDGGLVQAVLPDRIARTVHDLRLDVLRVPLRAEALDHLDRVDHPQTDDRVEVQGDPVLGHEVLEVNLELLGLHVHQRVVRGHRRPDLSGLDGRGVHSAVSEDPRLHDQDRLLAGARLDRTAAHGHDRHQHQSQVTTVTSHNNPPSPIKAEISRESISNKHGSPANKYKPSKPIKRIILPQNRPFVKYFIPFLTMIS